MTRARVWALSGVWVKEGGECVSTRARVWALSGVWVKEGGGVCVYQGESMGSERRLGGARMECGLGGLKPRAVAGGPSVTKFTF